MLKEALPDLNNKKYKFELLFTAQQENGFHKASFDYAVDNKAPTFIIVYTQQNNQVYGGFTKVKLNNTFYLSQYQYVLPDPNKESFIFLLRSDDDRFSDGIPYKWLLKKDTDASDWAISHSKACFGYGDWVIEFWNPHKPNSITRFGDMYDAGIFSEKNRNPTRYYNKL